MPARSPALNALTAAEKGELLDALLTTRPDLREQAEELATQQLSGVDPKGVADLQRHAQPGMTAAAAEMAVGILHGLHRCRDGGSESLLEYAPDFADERAAELVRQCRALSVDLPVDDLVDALTGWEPLFVTEGRRDE